MPDNKETIKAERRRPGGSAEPTGRAEAHHEGEPAAAAAGGRPQREGVDHPDLACQAACRATCPSAASCCYSSSFSS